MNKEQKKFLQLHLVEQRNYDFISKELGVPKSTLSLWYEDLKEERTKIALARTLWARKQFDVAFNDFYQWHLSTERKCNYCGITEARIAEMIAAGKLGTKRLPTRGRTLELDRKRPNEAYTPDNLVLACYWCNNAKTDTFTEEEFKTVGEVFKEIWKNRMES